jgi:hypothetical protein
MKDCTKCGGTGSILYVFDSELKEDSESDKVYPNTQDGLNQMLKENLGIKRYKGG